MSKYGHTVHRTGKNTFLSRVIKMAINLWLTWYVMHIDQFHTNNWSLVFLAISYHPLFHISHIFTHRTVYKSIELILLLSDSFDFFLNEYSPIRNLHTHLPLERKRFLTLSNECFVIIRIRIGVLEFFFFRMISSIIEFQFETIGNKGNQNI